MDNFIPTIGITMGDPAGIGPEIILKALLSPEIQGLCAPVILADERVMDYVAKKIGVRSPRRSGVSIISLTNLNPKSVGTNLTNRKRGRSMVAYIRRGVRMALRREIDALVTAPVNKEVLNRGGFSFSGHTEFIADMTETKDVCMMLSSEKLKVSLVTIHCALKDVSGLLNKQDIFKTILLTHNSLVAYFENPSPKIAVASLNPHAGEGQMFGHEDRYFIKPAVNKARKSGVNAEGPFPSDTLFYRAVKGEFDAVVAMYHDQGLIPIKLLSFGHAVNITLGLPIIRTSVDHGTASDIVGKGVANPSSLIYAIKMAAAMAKGKRQRERQMRKDITTIVTI
ncbi:MAG: 4-hydroxythreonine-4-phosphate dehydrogenase PdxA [Thermodesulfobacteriota bacterium]